MNWKRRVNWQAVLISLFVVALLLVSAGQAFAQGPTPPTACGQGCPSPWAPGGVWPETTLHSNGHMICCCGQWVEGRVCASVVVPEQSPAPEGLPAPSTGGGCPSSFAPGGVWPETTLHSNGHMICCGGGWVEGRVCASAVVPEPEQSPVPEEKGAMLEVPRPAIVDVSQAVVTAGRQTLWMASHSGIAVHHTAIDEGVRKGPFNLVEAWARLVDPNHTPYHFIIANRDGVMPSGEFFTDGTIWQIQSLAYRSGHSGDPYYAFNYIAISIDDNLSVHGFTPAAHRSVVELLVWLCAEYDILPANILGHREFGSTECPGTNVDMGAIRAEVTQALQEYRQNAGSNATPHPDQSITGLGR